MQKREHFVIMFGSGGRPRLVRLVYEKGGYQVAPIKRGEVSSRAERSHAQQALKKLRGES